MSLTVGKLAAFLDLDKTKFDRGLKSAEGGLVKFAGLLEGVGRTAGMGVAAQQAAALGAALAPLAGLLYAIPAAAGAGVLVMGTLKMATDGVGEAMEAAASGDAAKLQEALKGLAPEAQRFVLAADKIRDKLGEIKKTVQGKFFTGLDQDVQALATHTLPALGTGMTAVSKSLNGLVREGIQAASSPVFAGGMEKAGLSTASALGNFKGSVDALVSALPNLINAGMPLVDMFTSWAGEGLKSFGLWAGSAEGMAAMRAKAQAAADVLSKLGDILGNVWSTLQSVLAVAPGEGLLTWLVNVTGKLAELAGSAEGQAKIAQTFETLSQVGAAAGQALAVVAGIVAWLVDTINNLPGPVKDVVTSLAGWAIVAGPVLSMLTGVASGVLGVVGKIPALVSGIATAGSAMGGWIATGARVAAAWAVMAAQATAHAARVVAAWVAAAAQSVAAGARMAAAAAANAARVVAGWVLMGTQSLIQAARMAAAWVLSMGPVGWIIAAIVALAVLIYTYWDEIKAATVAAWTAVVDAVSSAWDSIVDAISSVLTWIWDLIKTAWDAYLGIYIWAGKAIWDAVTTAWNAVVEAISSAGTKIWQTIKDAWRQAVDAVTGAVSRIIDTVAELGSEILGSVRNLGSQLYQAGRGIIEDLWNGIKSLWGKVKDGFSGLMSELRAFMPFSPAKEGPFSGKGWTLYSGQSIVEGLADGMRMAAPGAIRVATAMAGQLANALPRPDMAMAGAPGAFGSPAGSGAGVSIGNMYVSPHQTPTDVARDLYWMSQGRGGR